MGEATHEDTVYQGQVAATLLKFLGIDYHELDARTAPPIEGAFPQASGIR
jgi:hypothetical protein